MANSTFSGNISNTSGTAGLNGAIFGAPNTLLRNTIVEKSTNGNCNAAVFDGGGNLSDDLSCVFSTATSLANTAAQLGPLQNNGGPTWTMAPLTGSPAIDLGVNQLAIDANLTTDQRGTGFRRISPTGGTVDRGAVEVQVDNAPPTCTASAKPSKLLQPNHKLVNITTDVAAIDNQPGVTFKLRSVTSTEADSGLGRDDVPLDIQGWTVGSADLTGQLRSERFSKAGRTYTITYEAKDVAGNVATCSATVTVPKQPQPAPGAGGLGHRQARGPVLAGGRLAPARLGSRRPNSSRSCAGPQSKATLDQSSSSALAISTSSRSIASIGTQAAASSYNWVASFIFLSPSSMTKPLAYSTMAIADLGFSFNAAW